MRHRVKRQIEATRKLSAVTSANFADLMCSKPLPYRAPGACVGVRT
jgi:hypothetical protein